MSDSVNKLDGKVVWRLRKIKIEIMRKNSRVWNYNLRVKIVVIWKGWRNVQLSEHDLQIGRIIRGKREGAWDKR